MSTSDRPTTLCEAFQRTAAIDPDAVALRTPGDKQTLTWREYADQVRQVAAGLAGLGVRRGDTVSLMMANRVEFYPLEVGAQHVGAISFSVYNTLAAEQLVYLFDNADTKVLMCEAQYVDRIRASGADIDHIVCLDGSPDGTLSVEDLIAAGADDFDFESAWRAVQPDDVATLIYTSGTTGNPKGVEMTHSNLLFQAFAVDEVLGVRFGDRCTSFLPTAHIADRMGALYFQEVFGTQITTVSDPRAIAAALPDVRPTVWGAVPRVWEKLKAAIEFAAANEPDETKRMGLQWGLAVAAKKAEALVAGEPVPEDVAAEWAQADELVLSKLREKLGLEQVRHAVSGAAPIPKETLAFFVGLGIPISEVWGMSELSCIATVSHPSDARLGTVGKLVPGMEGRIAEDGEFLVRGPLVMKGYRKEPQKTAEAVDDDGWLHTGDILEADEDGYLKVVDRKKETHHQRGGQEHVACQHREHHQGRVPARRRDARRRRCPPVQHRADRPRRRVGGTLRRAAGARRRVAGDAGRRSGPDRRNRRRGGRGQLEVVEGGADQALSGAADFLGTRRRRDHADDEAEAQADPREVRRRDRRTLCLRHRRCGARAEGDGRRCAVTSGPSRHVSVWIDVAPEVAYAIAADPEQMPRWASGLAAGGLRQTADGWVADSPMGQVTVEFAPPNEYGVLDHVVRMPSGEAVYNPLRVIPAGEGQPRCEVVFTVRRREGMTDEEFEGDVATVTADLDRLRQLAED